MAIIEINTYCKHLMEKHGGQLGWTKAKFNTPTGMVKKGDKGTCLSSLAQRPNGCRHECETIMADISQFFGESDFITIHPLFPVEPQST